MLALQQQQQRRRAPLSLVDAHHMAVAAGFVYPNARADAPLARRADLHGAWVGGGGVVRKQIDVMVVVAGRRQATRRRSAA